MDTAKGYLSFLPWQSDQITALGQAAGDDRSGLVYLEDAALQLAAETAIVTRRPLLIKGEPGTGKSSFAPFVARNLGWRYYEKSITGRTEARDLLWTFDALERLRDAQNKADVTAEKYVKPGVLWWAFNRFSAQELLSTRAQLRHAVTTVSEEPLAEENQARDLDCAVVLIDEIDKADSEVPNDLLEVIGLNRFFVDELSKPVERSVPLKGAPGTAKYFGSLLIVITTNEERDLPSAFLRRCVVHTLREPAEREKQEERLRAIAGLHMQGIIGSKPQGKETVSAVAQKFCEIRERPRGSGRRRPGTAEFLDAVRACLHLEITPESTVWQQIAANVILK